jgi:hypothetical protein
MAFGSCVRFSAVVVLCFTLRAGADSPPTSQPSTQPSAQQVRAWFGDLATRDGTVREAARMRLMGLERRDLPTLRGVVQESRPLAPAQATALYDIVMQIYLAGDPYDADETAGFLGVSLPREDMSGPESPVVILDRIPGFCAYRYLQDGDVVLSLVAPNETKFPNPEEFRKTIHDLTPGQPIEFEVLRQGQVVRVPMTLSPRPKAVEVDGQLHQLRQERDQKAFQYWRDTFAPLVGEEVSSRNPNDETRNPKE